MIEPKIVSFVVPVYNISPYLRRCVDSLLLVDSKICEIILVDDGSSDGSGDICDEYSRLHSNVFSFHKQNGGLSDARNFGIERSTANYLSFVDGDDFISAESIDALINELGKCCFDVVCIDYLKSVDGSKKIYNFKTVEDEDGIEFLRTQLSYGRMHAAAWRYICKKSFINEHGLFFKKGILHEDEEWTPRMLACAKHVKTLNQSFYVYVVRNNSIMTANKNLKNLSDFSMTMKSLLMLFSSLNDLKLYRMVKTDLVDKYLSIFSRCYVQRSERKKLLAKKELDGDIISKKTRFKLFLYGFSKPLLYFASKASNLLK